jgi:hypothetical protein
VILRLAIRSLIVRPWRTAVLTAGFGLGIGVMVALLGVGQVIIEQAHSPALQGGGDLVVSSPVGPLESARYLLANVLGSPELRPRVAAASPTRRATLYLIKPGFTSAVAVRGGIPSLERAAGDAEIAAVAAWTDAPRDEAWAHPPAGDVLRAMDRFHPVPATDPAVDSFHHSWAEWLYFNGRTADGSLRFYLTFLTGAPGADGQRSGLVRLQLDRNGHTENYGAFASVNGDALLERAPDLDIAGNRVRLVGGQYRLTLSLTEDPSTRTSDTRSLRAGPSTRTSDTRSLGARLEGEITIDASAGRSLPPTEIHGARGWLSGYVVPVLSGPVHGALRIGADTFRLDGVTGYHDHNWGFWEGVRWQWGQVAHDDVSIVFGRVFPPEGVADPARVPGFLGVLGPSGPIGFSTDVAVTERGASDAPTGMTIRARGPRTDLELALTVEESVATRMTLTQTAAGAAMNFLQLGGSYRVDGHVGGRAFAFTARGSAETFRSMPQVR